MTDRQRQRRAREAAEHRHWRDRLIRTYNETSAADRAAGLGWYGRAQDAAATLAAEYGLAEDQAAGIIAALSPRARWSVNLRAAERVAAAAAADRDRCPAVGLRRNALKAWRIARGNPAGLTLSGPKVRAFWRNITGDHTAVTVDVWASRAATGRYDAPVPSGRRYERLARAYAAAAEVVGVSPRDLQAAIWVHVRGGAD